MTLRILLREAAISARVALVPTTLVLLVVAAMCLAAIVTVGRQAAVEAAVEERLASPAARTLTINDTGASGALTPAVVGSMSRIAGVQAVIARRSPVDAVNGALGQGSPRVAVTEILGTPETVIRIIEGRRPGVGEAVLSEATRQSIGLDEAAGYLEATDGRQWAIVGEFSAIPPFEDLEDLAIAGADPTNVGPTRQVQVTAAHRDQVNQVTQAALALAAADPQRTQVDRPSALNENNQAITGQLAGLGRSLLLLILGTGAFLVAIVVLADVLIRRRDLGRRRTLGITRPDLVTLVTLRTSLPAFLGATVGTIIGAALIRPTGPVPLAFCIAVSTLALTTAVIAALPPAIYASSRDPVEVLRTP